MSLSRGRKLASALKLVKSPKKSPTERSQRGIGKDELQLVLITIILPIKFGCGGETSREILSHSLGRDRQRDIIPLDGLPSNGGTRRGTTKGTTLKA